MFIALFISTISIAQNQINYDEFFGETCTSIMVGRKASTDGSVITSHTCDGRYRTWLDWTPAAEYKKGDKDKIYKGRLKTENSYDNRNLEMVGEIPQAEKTYAFLNTAYPCLNEKQLAIGETTIVGPKELVNEKGMFLIEELERIVLQRCTNARDAIKLIGELVKEYGYGDWGECLTIADKKEVWQLEIFGAGEKHIGAVWAAQRIPDDHVGVSANISRIGKIDINNPDYFMFSENVFKQAKKLKRWDGKSEFKFWKAYGKVEKPFKIREYYILNKLAPSKKLSMDMDELPFSVKPDNKVSVHDVIALYRETYEGTEYDMTQNMKHIKTKKDDDGKIISTDTIIASNANPWPTGSNRKLYNYLKENSVEYQRTVAVAWCSYSHIIQLRDWMPDEIGGLAWFSFDNPAQSPRIPIYSGSTRLPESFAQCGQKRHTEDAAIWSYRKANKLATLNWQKTRKDIEQEVEYFENKVSEESIILEKKVEKLLKEKKYEEAKELLNRFTSDITGASMLRWEELKNKYWHKFGLGF
jgi:dipeptidase